ncbi:TetR/AcrR family transcriptional regulator [Conexibacter woesei]|uniref:Transcriptional regulator, TetR family n=1 Tax=Conexibacter woesei (strain DSM 14684 / CCUG 47730 / CIP 108061 / JCM 11494 / NBRC 100937 / ID131577) TaxID=469383 RepID=D3F7F6_CONWI|nr:TetR/AcrR family transcriptional regulator [Conexibacter woesei]ADB50818.1 transcriptional regulator, TetR family [Conexibacter woesei DSM 14684]
METPPLTRRERLRLQTRAEIRQHALEQVTAGGAAALSLNAIGKAMGMSGPAIYRYYASREELLAALVTDGYGELARIVEEAAAAGARRTPARRLSQAAVAYRAWALENPYRYELLFSVRPEGYSDPSEAIAAIRPAMVVLLQLIGAIAGEAGASGSATAAAGGKLDAQLTRWAAVRQQEGAGASIAVLRLGVLTWTRMHGIVTLELAGVVGDMGLDAGLLVQAELDAVVAAAAAG